MQTHLPSKRQDSTEQASEQEEAGYDREAVQLRSLAFAKHDAAQLRDPDQAQAIADRGTAGPAAAMPHAETIQQSFGRHDIGGIEAHVGGPAAAASDELGAAAYATGDQVAFRDQPGLHTAAHEAAHVVQQRAGVQLEGGMGPADGAAEAHADAVADRVVAGQSAEALLDQAPAAAGINRKPAEVQGSAIPNLTLDPPLVTFASAQVGQAVTQNVRVTNYGDEAIDIENLTAGGPFTVYLGGRGDLQPGESTNVVVVYRPTAAGDQAATLSVYGGGGAAVSTMVTGKAVDPPPPVTDTAAAGAPGAGPAASGGPVQGPAADALPVFGPQLPGADAPPPATLAPVSWLSATPSEVSFGANLQDEVGREVVLTNDGFAPVTIIDVYVVGGGGGVSAQLISPATISGGGAASVGMEYDPSKFTGQHASLVVTTDDGATIHVPITGPAESEQLSDTRGAGTLDGFPDTLAFAPHEAQGYGASKSVPLRNRGLSPISVFTVFSTSSSFRAEPKIREIAPGATIELDISFDPKEVGNLAGTIYLQGSDQEIYGSFGVEGVGLAKQVKQEDEPTPAKAPLGDGATERQRAEALGALRSWDDATQGATQSSYTTQHKDIIDFLTYASLDPTISPATMPDSSVLRSILSNAFGNAISDFGVQPGERVAPRAAEITRKLFTEKVEHVGADITFRESAPMIAGLVGVGAGFVVGVLVESLAGMLFDALFPDHAADEALEKAYHQGQADGAEVTGKKINEKIGKLDQAQTGADHERKRQANKISGQIMASTDANELAHLTAQLEGMTKQAETIHPAPGVTANGMLALWVRDHANSTTGANKELQAQWEKATTHLAEVDKSHFEKGKLKNQPDLFVAQCLHEWGLRGFTAPPELQAGIYDAIGASADDVADADQAPALAAKFHERFALREFVFPGADYDQMRDEIDDDEPNPAAGQEGASCVPVLYVQDGCCVVDRFEYRVTYGPRDVRFVSHPGKDKWEHVSTYDRGSQEPVPAHVAQSSLYGEMARLQSQGYDIQQEADAGANAAVISAFGAQYAVPDTMHSDGRAEPVSVFRMRVGAEQQRPLGYRQATVGDVTLYKVGNTILLIEGEGKKAE